MPKAVASFGRAGELLRDEEAGARDMLVGWWGQYDRPAAARKAGLPKGRVREYLPYRMLEVEVAANAVYNWAAQQILARRLTEERPNDPIQYAASVHHEAQALRYRAHEKLMRAFLDEEVFDGQIRVGPEPRPRRLHAQASLLEDQ